MNTEEIRKAIKKVEYLLSDNWDLAQWKEAEKAIGSLTK